MARLQFPAHFEQRSILQALRKAGLLDVAWSDLEILLSPRTRFQPSGVVLLGSWIFRARKEGRRVSINFPGDMKGQEEILQIEQLTGPGFVSSCEYPLPLCVPLQTVSDDEDLFRVVGLVCELVLKNISETKALLPAVEWCVNEVVDNILRHSDLVAPGCVCATFCPKTERLEIAISDSGRGILESIKESHNPFNNAEAISLAVTRGVTRDIEVGQGFGLAGCVEILEKSEGFFQLTSGDIRLERDGITEKYAQIPHVPGTLVNLSFDTSKKITLNETTIIGASTAVDWNYFDVIRDKIDSGQAIQLRKECIHFGGRGPAKALRTKILSILDHTPDPIVLDFSEVETVASSFLDELLGRLNSKLGVNNFRKLIKITNMNSLVERMAHVVIENRLEIDGVVPDRTSEAN